MAKLPPYLGPDDKDYLLLNLTSQVVNDELQPVPLTEVCKVHISHLQELPSNYQRAAAGLEHAKSQTHLMIIHGSQHLLLYLSISPTT